MRALFRFCLLKGKLLQSEVDRRVFIFLTKKPPGTNYGLGGILCKTVFLQPLTLLSLIFLRDHFFDRAERFIADAVFDPAGVLRCDLLIYAKADK